MLLLLKRSNDSIQLCVWCALCVYLVYGSKGWWWNATHNYILLSFMCNTVCHSYGIKLNHSIAVLVCILLCPFVFGFGFVVVVCEQLSFKWQINRTIECRVNNNIILSSLSLCVYWQVAYTTKASTMAYNMWFYAVFMFERALNHAETKYSLVNK